MRVAAGRYTAPSLSMPQQTPPETPLAAVTHPNPYPYYAALVQKRPLYRDETVGAWVATSAAAVTAVLTSEAVRVRPAAEPAPAALGDSAAAFLFRRLVRMTDGAAHPPLKNALLRTLGLLQEGGLLSQARASAEAVAEKTLEPATPQGLEAFSFGLSLHLLSSLLGLPERHFEAVQKATEAYLLGLMPSPSPECLLHGAAGAEVLLGLTRKARAAAPPSAFLGHFLKEAQKEGVTEDDVLTANAAGLLTQAYEGTAGLLGNTVLALGTRPELVSALRSAPEGLWEVLREVLRYDAPVQNTRRTLAREVRLCGQRLQAGDTVLVVLAAANRDPEANAAPDAFQPSRAARRTFTFGLGAHLCPGQALSLALARAGVEQLLQRGLDFSAFLAVGYRPSLNVRVPRFF
jgi:cytochrome P450